VGASEKLAKEYGVSSKTIERDAEFAKAVDKMNPEEKTEVLAGTSGKTKQEIKGFPLTDFRCPSIQAPY